MVSAPFRPCRRLSCNNITKNDNGYCDKCQCLVKVDKVDNRPSYRERGYSARWDKVRRLKASADPLCELCLAKGIITPVEIVHHVKPVSEFPELKLVIGNLVSLCRKCHGKEHSRTVVI